MSRRVSELAARAPRGVGVGLRPELWQDLVGRGDGVDLVEILVDDWLAVSPRIARRELAPILERFGAVAHGVGLSIGSADALDEGYIAKVGRLLDALGIEVYGEHLSFHRCAGREVGQFLPLPPTEREAERVARRVERVCTILGRPMLLENIAWLVGHPDVGLGEAGFVRAVAERADCGLLLDVENVVVNAANLHFDVEGFVEGLPLERVVQVHVAGGHEAGGFHVDSHAHPVPEQALALLSSVAERAPNLAATVLERDKRFPAWEELQAELGDVRAALERPAPEIGALAALREPEATSPPDPDVVAPEVLQVATLEALAEPARWAAGDLDVMDAAARAWLESIPAERVRAFGRILAYKRREKLQPLLKGTFRALGEQLPELLREYFQAEPSPNLSRLEDGTRLAAFVEGRADVPPLVAALARHEAQILRLRARPWRLTEALRPPVTQGFDYDPRALDAFGRGGDAPARLETPMTAVYRRKRRGVWVSVAGQNV